jgi:hypothetical protein
VTIYMSLAFWSDSDDTIAMPSRLGVPCGIGAPRSTAVTTLSAPHPRVKRTLYCYAQEHLASRLRDVLEVQKAAGRVATERGYSLGPLFIEEGSSGQAIQALIEAATAFHDGGAAVAVPSRGHFIPLGRPHEWQMLLEELTGHPLVFTGRTH